MPMMHSSPGPVAVVDGREVLYFAGTGYLGLQGRPEVARAMCEAVRASGIGTATSRSAVGYGDSPALLRLERAAADLFDAEDALCYPSGYLGPQMLLGALAGSFDVVLIDQAAHSSLVAAARQSERPVAAFRHADPDDLREKLRSDVARNARPIVLTDGVFAATGRPAPLDRYCDMLGEYRGATLLVDDAHGVGVLGEHGRGTLEHFGRFDRSVNAVAPEGATAGLSSSAGPHPNPLPEGEGTLEKRGASPAAKWLCAGLSKALGGYGGVIPGSAAFIAWLKGRTPIYRGTTPLPVPIAAASTRAIELYRAEPELRERLAANAARLKSGLGGLGFDVTESPVPVASITIGTGERMREVQRELLARGVAIAYTAHYSGVGEQGALRIAVFATHTAEMIDRLLAKLADVMR